MSKADYWAVIISPHLDDAVFSCGGRITELRKKGRILVLNIFTGYTSEVKTRGVVLSESRFLEEKEASDFLGFESKNLGELDASCRRKEYEKLGNIFRPPVKDDIDWLPQLRHKILSILDELTFQELYVPLGVGWHVDHVLSHQIFLPSHIFSNKIKFYEDVPYCLIPHSTCLRLRQLTGSQNSLSSGFLRQWWEISSYYFETAMIGNLKPWLFRQAAKVVVAVYFFRLLSLYQKKPEIRLEQEFIPDHITIDLNLKVKSMALYSSQFREFFTSGEDCAISIKNYINRFQTSDSDSVERCWNRP